MTISAKTVTRAVLLGLVLLFLWDYKQTREEALCAHAATVRSGQH